MTDIVSCVLFSELLLIYHVPIAVCLKAFCLYSGTSE